MLKKRACLLCLMALLSLVSCKPKYGVNSAPNLTTAAADQVILIDFDQISDDVIESMDPEDFPFVKNLTISGSNDTNMVEVNAEIVDNVSNEALTIFLDQLMREISNAAAVQDFRYSKSTDDSYGSFFQKYGVHYVITKGEETVEDVTVQPGESFPFTA